MACVIASTKGAGSYTVADFFRYDPRAAGVALALATLLLPLTIIQGVLHRRQLLAVPGGRPGGNSV